MSSIQIPPSNFCGAAEFELSPQRGRLFSSLLRSQRCQEVLADGKNLTSSGFALDSGRFLGQMEEMNGS